MHTWDCGHKAYGYGRAVATDDGRIICPQCAAVAGTASEAWDEDVAETFDHLLALFERLPDDRRFWYDRLLALYDAYTGEQGELAVAGGETDDTR